MREAVQFRKGMKSASGVFRLAGGEALDASRWWGWRVSNAATSTEVSKNVVTQGTRGRAFHAPGLGIQRCRSWEGGCRCGPKSQTF